MCEIVCVVTRYYVSCKEMFHLDFFNTILLCHGEWAGKRAP